ncbi:MAG: PIN domain-containing protein [Bacteroidota bacterium]
MKSGKIVIHADVILDHLRSERPPSILRRAMGQYFCYTTVFQAVEVFASLRTPRERQSARDAMSAMKILGLNPRNAMRYGGLFAAHPRLRTLDLLTAGLCLESRLPLLTRRGKDFRGIRGLTIVRPRAIGGNARESSSVHPHHR